MHYVDSRLDHVHKIVHFMEVKAISNQDSDLREMLCRLFAKSIQKKLQVYLLAIGALAAIKRKSEIG